MHNGYYSPIVLPYPVETNTNIASSLSMQLNWLGFLENRLALWLGPTANKWKVDRLCNFHEPHSVAVNGSPPIMIDNEIKHHGPKISGEMDTADRHWTNPIVGVVMSPASCVSRRSATWIRFTRGINRRRIARLWINKRSSVSCLTASCLSV